MNKGARKKRRRLNGRFWAVISVIALALIAVIIRLLLRGEEAIIDDTGAYGDISVTLEHEAVIIRDEIAVTADNFGRAEYMMCEGQIAEPGTHIMDVYKCGFNVELLHSLSQTELEIYNAQLEQLGETRDSALDGYNETVGIIEDKIADAVMTGKTEKILQLQTELKNVLHERGEYLKSVLQQTEKLKKLYTQEQKLLSLISAWKTELFAEKAGAVSFYFDDYENALNEEKLSMLTSGLISAAVKGKAAADWTTQSENLAYRLVATDHWYIVYLTDASEALRTAAGMRYTVKIEGFGEYEAKASEPVLSGEKMINILRVDRDIGDLINIRRVDISVEYSAGGFRIRLEGIIIKDGKRYIELVLSSEHRRVEIDVYSADKKYAVIDVKADGQDALSKGVRYWIPKRK